MVGVLSRGFVRWERRSRASIGNSKGHMKIRELVMEQDCRASKPGSMPRSLRGGYETSGGVAAEAKKGEMAIDV